MLDKTSESCSHDSSLALFIDEMVVMGGAENVARVIQRYMKPTFIVAGYANLDILPEFNEDRSIRALSEGRGYSALLTRLFLPVKFWTRKHLFRADVNLHTGWRSLVLASKKSYDIYYCHTPPRFAYDLKEQYEQDIQPILRPLFRLLVGWVRFSYRHRLRLVNKIYANSENVRRRLKEHLNIDAEVLYPPVDVFAYQWRGQSDFYLSTARLENYKRVHEIVEAFKLMPSHKLLVCSGGSELKALKESSSGYPNIEFLGWVSQTELERRVGSCIATIYLPVDEDFGMSPVESMAAGKPVIGVAEGGLLESIIDGKTGVLLARDFDKTHIVDAVKTLDATAAANMRDACEQRALRFQTERFIEVLSKAIHGYDS